VTISTRQLAVVVAAALLALLLIATAAMLGADPALAKASDVGKNLGQEVGSWAKAILLGVAALVAIPILAKRDMAGGVVVAALAILVGGFVFAPGAVKDVVRSLWGAVGG